MARVEIVYRLADGEPGTHERPHDSEEARRHLNDGNRAFASLFTSGDADVRREIDVDPRDFGWLASGDAPLRQAPFAAVLGCADARVPVELIFNKGPNDLFVVRVAGNTLGDDVLGSLKYAVEHLRQSLKLIVVLGHSGCGAVTAAVDVFLDPARYLSLASAHSIRMLIDRLQVAVHVAALGLDQELGSAVRGHPHYREMLIETTVLMNAAVAAHTLRQSINLIEGADVGTAYGVYVLSDRLVWAPRGGSDEVLGVTPPPDHAQGFVDLAKAALHSKRMTDLLAA
jgi:carbonic anhydrase